MITCPFCSTEIDDGLSRFGGNCPHCFNVIPGEEAPTDPGVAAAPVVAASSEAAGGSKMILVFGFLAFVAVGAAVGIGRKDSAESEEQAQGEMALQIEENRKAEEEERLAVVAADEEQAAEEKAAAEAAALEEKEAAEVAARERARAAALSKARASEPSVVSTPSDNSAELAVASAPIRTSPTREVASGILETPAEINRAIRNSLRRYKGQLEQCYNIELNENEGLKGRWEVSFTVETTGKTSSVSVRGITGSHADLEACMLKNVKRWSFPRIAGAIPYVKEYAFGR